MARPGHVQDCRTDESIVQIFYLLLYLDEILYGLLSLQTNKMRVYGGRRVLPLWFFSFGLSMTAQAAPSTITATITQTLITSTVPLVTLSSVIGSLVTPFTQNPHCSDLVGIDVSGHQGSATDFAAISMAIASGSIPFDIEVNTACYPSGFLNPQSTSTQFPTYQYYSPGFCPSSWPVGFSSAGPSGTAIVTDIVCCPPGFALDGDPGTYPVNFCTSNVVRALTSTCTVLHGKLSVGAANLTSVNIEPCVFTAGNQFAVYPLQVQHQSSDLYYLLSSVAASFTSSHIASSSGSASQSHTAASASTDIAAHSILAAKTGGLSTGAKIGIGIGVPLVVIIVAATIAIVLLRRRSPRNQHGRPVEKNPCPPSATTESPAGLLGGQHYPSGVSSYDYNYSIADSAHSGPAELYSPPVGYYPSELPSPTRVELSAAQHR